MPWPPTVPVPAVESRQTFDTGGVLAWGNQEKGPKGASTRSQTLTGRGEKTTKAARMVKRKPEKRGASQRRSRASQQKVLACLGTETRAPAWRPTRSMGDAPPKLRKETSRTPQTRIGTASRVSIRFWPAGGAGRRGGGAPAPGTAGAADAARPRRPPDTRRGPALFARPPPRGGCGPRGLRRPFAEVRAHPAQVRCLPQFGRSRHGPDLAVRQLLVRGHPRPPRGAQILFLRPGGVVLPDDVPGAHADQHGTPQLQGR